MHVLTSKSTYFYRQNNSFNNCYIYKCSFRQLSQYLNCTRIIVHVLSTIVHHVDFQKITFLLIELLYYVHPFFLFLFALGNMRDILVFRLPQFNDAIYAHTLT